MNGTVDPNAAAPQVSSAPVGDAGVAEPAPDPAGDTAADPAAGDSGAVQDEQEDEATARRAAKLALLLDRMSRHADFPSMKESIRGIQKVSRSELAHMRALTDEVLEDVALTNKLLRLINTAYYRTVGGGSITTISRAVALMGFDAIGMLAASLALFERLPKGADGARVREEFACALMAALIADELCPSRKLQESAYITALLQNLGVMLAWLHLAEEAREVEGRLLALHPDQADEALAVGGAARAEPDEVERTSRDVLGVGYQELGIEIAQQWGWPVEVVHALRPLPTPAPEQPIPPHDFIRGVSTAANRLARELFGCAFDQRPQRLADFLLRWGFALTLDEERLTGVVERTLGQWTELAPVMNLPRPELLSAMTGQPAGQAATKGRGPAGRAAAGPASKPPAVPPRAGSTAAASAPAKRPPASARADDPQRIARLTSGIEQLSLAAMSDANVGALMQTFMQLLSEALQLERVLICLRMKAPERLEGRIGLGAQTQRLVSLFRVPLQPPADLFGLLCLKGTDTLISDTSDPLIAQRLPEWFRTQVKAPAFLLLPLQRGGQVVGMVYADRPKEGREMSITERELGLVKGLRNQVLLALQLREGANPLPPAPAQP